MTGSSNRRGTHDRRVPRRRGRHSSLVIAWPVMELLERAEQVATVVDRYAQVDRHGQLVLISGEAGAGKSALVQDLLDHHLSGARVLVGRCDDLFAPRPLGPPR